VNQRAPSPDTEIVLSASNSLQENLGPSAEADADFAKELVKLMTDNSADSRRVDKRTALALWDSAVIPPNMRKKKITESGEDGETSETTQQDKMAFTVITRRGNKQQVSFMVFQPGDPISWPFRHDSWRFLRSLR
jgi:regulator of nonsense transcripts 2